MSDESKANNTVVDWTENEQEVEVDLGVNNDVEDNEEVEPIIPEELAILPLRGVVVYPQTIIPLTVGQPRSIKLVDEVVGGDKLVGLVAAINPELESPGP